MIVATCLNPALDVTYEVPGARLGAVHRVAAVRVRAGGKGTNVARVLRRLGADALLVGPVGGATGAAFTADLDVAHHLVPIAGETRRSVTVVDDSTATVFNEAGPELHPDEWAAVHGAVLAALPGASFAVLSGSRPPGTPVDAYGRLVAAAREAGVPTLLDADGESLTAALPSGPDIVKVNEAEAQAAVGGDVEQAARRLVAAGAGAAVITRGADGLLALVDGVLRTARPGALMAGNPTGAGDALAAALAHALATGQGWDGALATAVAVSAASVAVPHAGDHDVELAARLRPEVEVQRR